MGQTDRTSFLVRLASVVFLILLFTAQDVYGFAFVKGIPKTPEATEALVRRIAFIRETHYGGFWDFTADLKHGDLAYSDQELRGHTDTTYFTDVCYF